MGRAGNKELNPSIIKNSKENEGFGRVFPKKKSLHACSEHVEVPSLKSSNSMAIELWGCMTLTLLCMALKTQDAGRAQLWMKACETHLAEDAKRWSIASSLGTTVHRQRQALDQDAQVEIGEAARIWQKNSWAW